MFTYRDRTVHDARELFASLAESPPEHFGLKDVGLPRDEMAGLVHDMKSAGKTSYLEVVSLSEEEGLAGASLAVELDCAVLMGTVFFDSIQALLQDEATKYYPFAGDVHGHPSVLAGSTEDIVAHAHTLQEKGVDGIDLLTYRHTGDDPDELLRQVVRETDIPVVSAGSIDSFDRISAVCDTRAWGFTIGSAFFDRMFVRGGSFKHNVMAVWNWLQTEGDS
jgi:hypothetical protein